MRTYWTNRNFLILVCAVLGTIVSILYFGLYEKWSPWPICAVEWHDQITTIDFFIYSYNFYRIGDISQVDFEARLQFFRWIPVVLKILWGTFIGGVFGRILYGILREREVISIRDTVSEPK